MFSQPAMSVLLGGDVTCDPQTAGMTGSEFTVNDARTYIAAVRWQFAKTMPQWPHEYRCADGALSWRSSSSPSWS
jgi:hypothetical protein